MAEPISPSATRLLQAMARGDAQAVEAMVAHERELLGTHDELGRSLVTLALYTGQHALAWELVRRGAPEGIHEASALGDLAHVRELLRKDPRLVGAWSPDGWTPLHLAAFFGHAAVCVLLLDAGAPAQEVARNALANQPLHAAAAGGHLGAVQVLLAHGADPRSTRSHGGSSPLHLAADGGEADIVQALLDAGAEVAQRDEKGRTPIDLADQSGRHEVASLMLRHGARDLRPPAFPGGENA